MDEIVHITNVLKISFECWKLNEYTLRHWKEGESSVFKNTTLRSSFRIEIWFNLKPSWPEKYAHFPDLSKKEEDKRKEGKNSKSQPDFQNQAMQTFMLKDVPSDVTYNTRSWKDLRSPLIWE